MIWLLFSPIYASILLHLLLCHALPDIMLVAQLSLRAIAASSRVRSTNDDGHKYGFTAIKGWDAATGMGTPNYSEMVEAL